MTLLYLPYHSCTTEQICAERNGTSGINFGHPWLLSAVRSETAFRVYNVVLRVQ